MEPTYYEVTVQIRGYAESTAALAQRVRAALETHPTLSLRVDAVDATKDGGVCPKCSMPYHPSAHMEDETCNGEPLPAPYRRPLGETPQAPAPGAWTNALCGEEGGPWVLHSVHPLREGRLESAILVWIRADRPGISSGISYTSLRYSGASLLEPGTPFDRMELAGHGAIDPLPYIQNERGALRHEQRIAGP